MQTTTEPVSTTDATDRATGLARTLTVLALWFFLAMALGITGSLLAASGPPLAIGAAIALPLLLFAVDARRSRPWLQGLAQLDLPALSALQTFRVVGAVFIVAWAEGSLPAGFALPAGLGDVAVGLTAPFVAAALAARKPHARRLALIWNVAGVTDLVLAVTFGVAHSRSSFGFLATSPTTDAMARYPLSLIPTFLVPLAIVLHVQSLRALAPAGTLRVR